MGVMVQCTNSGEWECPPVAEELKASGIWSIKEYIQRRKYIVAAQVACQPMYELCMGKIGCR